MPNTNSLFLLSKIVADQDAFALYEEHDSSVLRQVFEKLLSGHYRSCLLEALNSKNEIYSIRISKSWRALFTAVTFEGETCWQFLQIGPHSLYSKSKFLRPSVSKQFQQPVSEDKPKLLLKPLAWMDENGLVNFAIALKGSSMASSSTDVVEDELLDDVITHSFVSFSKQQNQVQQAQLPLLVSGVPGSGKSLVLESILENLVIDNAQKNPGYRILYVTPARRQAEKAQQEWNKSPQAANSPQGMVTFRDWNEVLREQDVPLLAANAENNRCMKHHFSDWFKRQSLAKGVSRELLHEGIRLLLGDVTKPSARLSDEHQQLALSLFIKYEQHCREKTFVNPYFTALPLQEQYDVVLIDEGQNLSRRALRSLFALARSSQTGLRQVVCCLDPQQAWQDSVSVIDFIVETVRGITHVQLQDSWRCSKRVQEAINCLNTSLKYPLTGGLASRAEVPLLRSACATDQLEGDFQLLGTSAGDINQLNERYGDDSDCIILTHECWISEARKVFRNALVMSIDGSGAEARTVIVYRPFDLPIFKDANRELLSVSRTASSSSEKSIHLPGRGKGNPRYFAAMQTVYMMCSRSLDTLIICQQKGHHDTKQLLEPFQLLADSYQNQARPAAASSFVPSRTTWEQRAQEMIEDGELDIAQRISERYIHAALPMASSSRVSESQPKGKSRRRKKPSQKPERVSNVTKRQPVPKAIEPLDTCPTMTYIRELNKLLKDAKNLAEIEEQLKNHGDDELENGMMKLLSNGDKRDDIINSGLFARLLQLESYMTRIDVRAWFHKSSNGGSLLEVLALWAESNPMDDIKLQPGVHMKQAMEMTAMVCLKNNNVPLLKGLLKLGLAVDHSYAGGRTLCHLAVEYHAVECLDHLLACGAPFAERNKDGLSPAQLAATQGALIPFCKLESKYQHELQAISDLSALNCEPLVKAILAGLSDYVIPALSLAHKCGATLTIDGIPLLVKALERNKPLMVAMLLQRDCDVIAIAKEHPIGHLAASIGSIDVLNALHARGFDMNTLHGKGETMAHVAAWQGYGRFLRLLKEYDADLNLPSGNYLKQRPIHSAAFKGHLETVKVLLDCGVSPKSQDEAGETCLHAAIRGEQADVVRYLLDLGMKPRGEEAGLCPPIVAAVEAMAASATRDTKIFMRLVRKDKMVLLDTYKGLNLAHVAVVNELCLLLQFIYQQVPAFDFTAPETAGGKTCAHLAVFKDAPDIIRWLADKNPDWIMKENKNGKLPVTYAAELGRVEAFKELMSYEANRDHNIVDMCVSLALSNGQCDILQVIKDRKLMNFNKLKASVESQAFWGDPGLPKLLKSWAASEKKSSAQSYQPGFFQTTGNTENESWQVAAASSTQGGSYDCGSPNEVDPYQTFDCIDFQDGFDEADDVFGSGNPFM